MITNQKNILEQWFIDYGPPYLSHATNNHAEVLKEKRLLSAEEILRKKGFCECEVNPWGHRGQVTKMIKPEKTNFNLSYQKTSKKSKQLFDVYIVPKFSNPTLPAHVEVKDRNLFFTYKIPMAPPPREKKEEKLDDMEQFIASISDKFLVHETSTVQVNESDATNIAHYCTSEQIEMTLREIYQFGQKKRIYHERALLDLRDRIFGLRNSYIRGEIRTMKSGVLWNYGSLAVIIGRPAEKLFSMFPMGLYRHMPFNSPISDGCEFYLKAPFQIACGFYSEPLDSKENLILGSKVILDSYRMNPQIDECIKARFVDIESLDESQRKIFSIK